MKMKKFISAIAAVAMLTASMATIASADATIEWSADDGVYFISDIDKMSERTPSIEVTNVKQMTSDEVVALGTANTSSISKLKLKNTSGKYGDTATYTMYQVDAKFVGVGDLVMGYDDNGDTSKIALMALCAAMDLTGVSVADIGYAKTTDATTGVAWTGGLDGNIYNLQNQLGNDNAIPKEDTTEGGIINEEYPFTVYVVLNAGTEATIPFAATASVQYLKNADFFQIKTPATSFTLKEAKATTDVEIADVTSFDKTATFEKDGAQYYHAAFKKEIAVGADNNAVAGLKLKGDKEFDVMFDTVVKSAKTVNVAINILNVPADATLGTITITPIAE